MKTKQQNPPQIGIVCVCVCVPEKIVSDFVYRVHTKGGVYRLCLFIHLDPSVNYWRVREEVY